METPSGRQQMTLINESGLYSLILSSKLPTAKRFKRWITHDVIPAIRQHGAYFTDAALLRLLSDPTQAHMLVVEYMCRRLWRMSGSRQSFRRRFPKRCTTILS